MRFTARLSAPLDWTVTVTDAAGEPVAERTGTGDRISWFWDSAEVAARPLHVDDGGRPASGPASGVLGGGSPARTARRSARPPVAADLWPQPRVVSPDGDGYADLLTVRYTLSEPRVGQRRRLKDETRA